MKRNQTKKNPYATNKGGRIQAPTAPATDRPVSTVRKGDDLRK